MAPCNIQTSRRLRKDKEKKGKIKRGTPKKIQERRRWIKGLKKIRQDEGELGYR